jgi:hypothetical protein
MRILLLPLAVLVGLAGPAHPASAAPIADYLGVATATLTITAISSTTDFVITIDPIFLDPEFNIVEEVETSGSGNHEALAEARAALNAFDPFDVGVGDTLVATASVGGFVDGPEDALADSLALPIIGLSMINLSLIPVVVEFEVAYSLSVAASAQAPANQSAAAEANVFVDTLVNPAFENAVFADTLNGDPPILFEETVAFVLPVEAGEIGQLSFSTGAIGLADHAVPEPTALALWLTGSLTLAAARRARRPR